MNRPSPISSRGPERETSSGTRLAWFALGSLLAYWFWRRSRHGGGGEEGRDDPVSRDSIARGHEPPTDTNVRGVVAFAVMLLVLVSLVLAGVAGLSRLLQKPAPEAGYAQTPPAPRLQIDPALDLNAMRAREDSTLNGYGWVDRARGIARVPIGRAMDLVAARGLPYDTTAADAVRVPTESGFSVVRRGPPPPTAPAYGGGRAQPYAPSPDRARRPGLITRKPGEQRQR